MSEWLIDFWVQTLAGVVGVFLGVWLALNAGAYSTGRVTTNAPRRSPTPNPVAWSFG